MASTAMDGPGHAGTIETTIPSGSSTPAAGSHLKGNQLVGVIFPPAWDAAAMTWLVSMDGVSYYSLLQANGGSEYSTTVTAGKATPLAPADFAGWRYVKPVSGTAALAVNQTADRLVQLIVRPV